MDTLETRQKLAAGLAAYNALQAILKIHRPMKGEAWPADRRRYCSVCVRPDQSFRTWPCPTVAAANRALKPVEQV